MSVIDGPTPAGPGRVRPRLRNDLEMSLAARRAIEAADAPVQKERFVHETDIGNVDSIRRHGLRPSRGGGAMGHEGVYAYQGGYAGEPVPEGRARIEFQADPRRISGRGTTPGSRAVALSGGQIDPADIMHGYSSTERLFDAGSTVSNVGSLLNSLSAMLGGPSLMSPLDWAGMQTVDATRRAAGMDVYDQPGQHWSEQVPSYTRLGHSVHGGRTRPRRYERTVYHQSPTGTVVA